MDATRRRRRQRRRQQNSVAPVANFVFPHAGAVTGKVVALVALSEQLKSSFRVTSIDFEATSAKSVSWQIQLRGSAGNESTSVTSALVTTCGSTRRIRLHAPRYTDWSLPETNVNTHVAWVRSSADANSDARFSCTVRVSVRIEEFPF